MVLAAIPLLWRGLISVEADVEWAVGTDWVFSRGPPQGGTPRILVDAHIYTHT